MVLRFTRSRESHDLQRRREELYTFPVSGAEDEATHRLNAGTVEPNVTTLVSLDTSRQFAKANHRSHTK